MKKKLNEKNEILTYIIQLILNVGLRNHLSTAVAVTIHSARVWRSGESPAIDPAPPISIVAARSGDALVARCGGEACTCCGNVLGITGVSELSVRSYGGDGDPKFAAMYSRASLFMSWIAAMSFTNCYHQPWRHLTSGAPTWREHRITR